MKITAKMLEEKGACESQIVIFRKEWPKGAIVNKKNALRAVELDLDIKWAAVTFFAVAARAEYEKVRDATLAEYEKACALAFVEASKK